MTLSICRDLERKNMEGIKVNLGKKEMVGKEMI